MRPARGVWSLLPQDLVLHAVVNPTEYDTRDAKAPLKVHLVLAGFPPVHS